MRNEKLYRIYRTIMLIVITAFITFLLTTTFFTKNVTLMQKKNLADLVSKDTSSSFTQKMKMLKGVVDQCYLYDEDESKMEEEAYKGYIQGLGDPYTQYFTKQETQDFLADTNGEFVGIGIYMGITKDESRVLVISPIAGSPAEEVGILPGDIITKVDGVEYTGEQLEEMAAKIKGEEGTKVTIEILRGEETKTFEITRRTVTTIKNEAKVINNNIGYLQLGGFTTNSANEVKSELEKINTKNLKGLIIDLRNNGGGLVDDALDIADLFVDKDKTLLITKSKGDNETVNKSKTDKVYDLPVVILTNEYSASASEILAGALRDINGVKLVGTTTYGKGVIQFYSTLTDGSSIKVTANEYFTPNHTTINKVGLKPDVEVQLPEGKSLYEFTQDDDPQLQKAIELLK